MVRYGCYIIKDEFFEKFDDPYLKGNKKENRPHYCCFPDKENDKLFWVIPMSHKISKYGNIISKRIANGKSCDILHIIEIGGKKSAMLIQDMFPITENYIERPYTINSIPLIVKNILKFWIKKQQIFIDLSIGMLNLILHSLMRCLLS